MISAFQQIGPNRYRPLKPLPTAMPREVGHLLTYLGHKDAKSSTAILTAIDKVLDELEKLNPHGEASMRKMRALTVKALGAAFLCLRCGTIGHLSGEAKAEAIVVRLRKNILPRIRRAGHNQPVALTSGQKSQIKAIVYDAERYPTPRNIQGKFLKKYLRKLYKEFGPSASGAKGEKTGGSLSRSHQGNGVSRIYSMPHRRGIEVVRRFYRPER